MIDTQHLSPDTEALAQALAQHEDYRVLRRVPRPYSAMPHMGAVPDGRCIAIIDTETTGLDSTDDVIIELAVLLCFVDDAGELVGHFGPISWLADPGRELDPRISLITGLDSRQLEGQMINDEHAFGLLDRADLILAHNARFDAKFIERRYPDLAGRAWACSCSEIDWPELGFEGRSQSALLAHLGWFSDAHRGKADVWSLFWLAQHRSRDEDGVNRTHLARLLEASRQETVMVEARRAPFAVKDRLRARGYHWNPVGRFWQIELSPQAAEHERSWGYREGLPAMTTRPITACERHR